MLGLRQGGGGHPEFNEGSPPEGTAVSGEDVRAYRERLQVRRGDYRHFLCEGQARQERQARRKAREMEEAFVQQADGEMFYRLREKERGSAPAS